MKKEKKKGTDELAASAGRLVSASSEFATTTVKIAYEVWEKSKIRALRRGLTLAKLVENALRRELGEEDEEEPKK